MGKQTATDQKEKTKKKPQPISLNLQPGEKLARLSYLTVMSVKPGKNGPVGVTVMNEQGFSWDIDAHVLDAECTSAVQFESTEKVSQTEMIERMLDAGHNVFTANYNKKPDAEAAATKMKNLYPNKGIKGVGIASRAEYDGAVDNIIKEILAGEERTITAHIISIDRNRGRVTVVDMNAPKNNNVRQVDPRTLNWLIIGNIKYVLK